MRKWGPGQKWSGNLAIRDLLSLYRSGELRPSEVIQHVYARIAERGDDHVWISVVSESEALERAHALENGPRDYALYGIPFAVKDVFDVSGLPTTAVVPHTHIPPAVPRRWLASSSTLERF